MLSCEISDILEWSTKFENLVNNLNKIDIYICREREWVA